MARNSAVVIVMAVVLAACSIKRMAVDIIGDALSGGGGVFASEEDPQLIREALPFGLKTYESLLAISPEHEGLLLAAASGFAAYAFLLQREADEIDATDLTQARELRARARNLYLRGRDFALRGLELAHPNFVAQLYDDARSTLTKTEQEDVPYLYWAGAAWAGALSAAKDDLTLLAELPLAAALVGRVLVLDEVYGQGVAHEFFISYEGTRPGGSRAKAREHYRRALELSDGLRASVHLALAEAVTVREQNLDEFRALVAAAKGVELDKAPNFRLVNTLARERAVWLESRIPELFLEVESGEEKG